MNPRTNYFSIPVCRLSIEEREAITGVDRRQMRLPLPIAVEVSDVTVQELHPKGEIIAPSTVQELHPTPSPNLQEFKGSGATRKTISEMVEISEETEELIRGVTEQLRGRSQESHKGPGTLLRERLGIT